MVISSIDLARVLDVSRTVTGVVDESSSMEVVDAVAVLTPVRGAALSGMTSMGYVCSFSFTNLSNSTSISLIYAFCSMINFSISSFWPSVLAGTCGKMVCETLVEGGCCSESSKVFISHSVWFMNFSIFGLGT
jgi:hypothetical protein